MGDRVNVLIPEARTSPPLLDGSPSAAGELGIGLLGCGVVGSAVVRALARHAGLVEERTGRTPVIRAIAVRDPYKPRELSIPSLPFTDDPLAVAIRDDVDVVVEAIGGQESGPLIEAALCAGKHVVTANKELLSRRLRALLDLATVVDRQVLFEASVMSGVPVVAILSGGLNGDPIAGLEGILNGTTNYCLHRMEEGLSLEDALQQARALGFAEPDSSADVEGRDSAAKLAILSTLAFGTEVTLDDVSVAGITSVTPREVAAAKARGEALRLVAEARRTAEGVTARVEPRYLPSAHRLARVIDHHNALLIETALSGSLFVEGPGAGGEPTAGAILGDIIRAAGRAGSVDPNGGRLS